MLSEEEYEQKSFRISRDVDLILGHLTQHEEWRGSCVNLIPSENLMLPLAERYLTNDFGHRYAEGDPFKRYYQGTKYLDLLDVQVQEIVQRLFGAKHAELRVISGTMANMAVFHGLRKKGTYLNMKISDGSHVSHTRFGSGGLLGMRAVSLPFNLETFQPDFEKMVALAMKEDPDFLVVGKSLFLFPEPLREIKDLLPDVPLVYDAAHVLGLIAGKRFQDPFREGADIITASTHKTFPGPQGGLVLFNDEEHHAQVKKAAFPGLTCSWHSHRIIALGITALWMERSGRAYADQVIKNAQTLARCLAERGLQVLGEAFGYTKSHTLAIHVREHGGGRMIAERLEKNNIILNKNSLPGETFEKGKDMHDPDGIRLGTPEMTMVGMKAPEMEYIADLIGKVVLEGRDVRDDVIELRSQFPGVAWPFP